MDFKAYLLVQLAQFRFIKSKIVCDMCDVFTMLLMLNLRFGPNKISIGPIYCNTLIYFTINIVIQVCDQSNSIVHQY